MDDETVRMLEDLPDDLRERGWTFVPSASRAPWSASWHRAVYHRPFDDRLDRERGISATYNRLTRRQIVRVSTHSDHSPSWHDARQDAIRRIAFVDHFAGHRSDRS